MKVVYIAGPFRAKSYWGQVQNIRVAEKAALEVWCLGAAALCPHLNTAHFQGAAHDEVWLKGDLELMSRCDAVLVVGEWERSEGTRAEVAVARARNLPVFASTDALEKWLEEQNAN